MEFIEEQDFVFKLGGIMTRDLHVLIFLNNIHILSFVLNVTYSRAQIAVCSSSPFFGMKVVKSELGGLVRKEIN